MCTAKNSEEKDEEAEDKTKNPDQLCKSRPFGHNRELVPKRHAAFFFLPLKAITTV
jgi:hypothetical protein